MSTVQFSYLKSTYIYIYSGSCYEKSVPLADYTKNRAFIPVFSVWTKHIATVSMVNIEPFKQELGFSVVETNSNVT